MTTPSLSHSNSLTIVTFLPSLTGRTSRADVPHRFRGEMASSPCCEDARVVEVPRVEGSWSGSGHLVRWGRQGTSRLRDFLPSLARRWLRGGLSPTFRRPF